MASKLIAHLRKKSQEHAQLKLLLNQWEFDEILIPKALQNVGQLFPHYSRHDASHSVQILVNIERLLGDDIDKLGATDTWLILEAAFWHDIGMVVPADLIAKDLDTPEFRRFVADIVNTTGHELRDFAKRFDPKNASSCFTDVGTPIDAVEKLRQLLADYYRRQHPRRAETIVIDPWKQAGISSPRNELLPKRLFSLLGRICHLHGKDFSCILEEVDFRQVGMGGESCHPRFIACLLRLGDLLDLEDNRFCPVMLRMVGSIPRSSQAHIDKHNSIRHFRLDRDRIEVTASCDNSAAYEETERWFSWLKQEIQQQMAHWQDIVPERAFGLLPTLGNLRVNLDGDEQWLDYNFKERPRFDIDPEKTIELLQGTGLYENPKQSLRELLQNAVDATLQRVWLEYCPSEGNAPLHDSLKPDNWDDPYDPKMAKLLQQYAIEVRLDLAPDQTKDGLQRWCLSIRDHGIGISKDDIKWMRRVGSSSRKPDRQERAQKMPQWMRPSGAFGIGLQSVFMLTESVRFQTKSYLTSETHEILMNSPLGAQRGLITIKKLELPVGAPCGSTLILEHDFKKMPERISWGGNKEDRAAYEGLCGFDPIAHEELEFEPLSWLDEVSEFARNSPVPVRCYFKGQSQEIEREPQEYDFFDRETNIALKIVTHLRSGREFIYFRGQPISKYNGRVVPFMSIYYHLWGDTAGSLLSINRNSIKFEGEAYLIEKLDKALANYLRQVDVETLETDVSTYLCSFIHACGWEEHYEKFGDRWKNLPLTFNNKTFRELYGLEGFRVNIEKLGSPGFEAETPTSEADQNVFEYGPQEDAIRLKLLAHEWQKSGFYLQMASLGQGEMTLAFKKAAFVPSFPYTASALKGALKQFAKIIDPFIRVLAPLYPDYMKLATRKGTQMRFVSHIQGLEYLRTPFMVMPFCFFFGARTGRHVTVSELDALCVWTVENAIDRTLTKDDARTLYEKFIDWIDNEIMKDDEDWKNFRVFNPHGQGTL